MYAYIWAFIGFLCLIFYDIYSCDYQQAAFIALFASGCAVVEYRKKKKTNPKEGS